MAESGNETITKGKIKFWRNIVIGRTLLSTIFKGTFEGRIDVAVKRIPLDLAKSAENEIKVLLERTDHDNLVKYYCSEQDDDFCYIAMQLCLCNLEEYVEKKGNYLRHVLDLPDTPVEEILRGAADGLSHIHKKDIIHRDIKPSNVLLFVKEDKLVAKISDFGISRIIPDCHTATANFSVGTDMYKAPELLTPQFSWRSDVYAFGLVVFYVLSKGKHLFDNNRSQIIEGNPVNLQELNGQPAALSLVKWLTAFKQEERPRMTEVLYHPFFWDDEKKLNFITNVHQKTEDINNPFLKEAMEEDSHHVICSSPDNCGNQRTPPDPAVCADWTTSLAPSVKADFPRKVNVKSCTELVRIIRNKLTHFYDPKHPVKPEYGGEPEGFRRYWLEKFPSLVVHLWEKVEVTHLAAFFRGYYAPESVRRTNVETTLLRTIEEGELRDPQELLNKVKRLGSTIWERALRLAVVKGRKELVEAYLEDGTGADIERGAEVNGKDEPEWTPLYRAVLNGQLAVARVLIECGAEVDCKTEKGNTLLHTAASYGHSEVAKVLIELGAEVNCRDGKGFTPLHAAAVTGHSEVAKLLIELGAEVNCRDGKGFTPLHAAAVTGHSEVAELLIDRSAEVNCKDEYEWTPLHAAEVTGHSEVAKLLIERGAEINYKNKTEGTPLLIAALEGHSVVAKLLIERGADVDCKDKFGQTPLHGAASNGHSEVAKLLIELGAQVDCKDTDGQTLLHIAASNGHSEVAKLLIECDTEIDCRNEYEWTPLHGAASNGHSEVAKLLIERGAQVNCKDSLGQTLLHIAASNGHSEVAKLLIERDTEVDCRNEYEWTPLYKAASNGHSEVAELLIERGAQVNCKDTLGQTLLHIVASNGHSEVAKLIIERGAEVNCKDTYRRTPLYKAALNGHSEVAKLLIERGAHVNCKDTLKQTLLHIVASNGHSEVAKLIIERGAEVNCKDTYRRTPLYKAALNGHSEVAKLLIERGAKVDCKSAWGFTPLDCAIAKSHKEMIELLRNLPAENLPSEPNK